jgi:predicted nucleic acid-binding protein
VKIVFLDTSTFVALKDEYEINHSKTIDCFNSLIKKGDLLLNKNYIFDEVYIILIKRFRQSQAVDFGKTIIKSSLIQYFLITKEIKRKNCEISYNIFYF